MPTKNDTERTPQPEWHFDTPTFEEWLHCPNCLSTHVNLKMTEMERSDELDFVSKETLWFKCASCGNRTRFMRGLPVEQEIDDTEADSLLDRLVEIFT